VIDEFEPRAVGFHHHVEQHDGDIGGLLQQLAAFGRRVGGQEFDAVPFQRIIVEREARSIVHRRIVVDDRDLPRPVVGDARRRFVVDETDDVVVAHFLCSTLLSSATKSGALIGRTMPNDTPRSGSEASEIRPPSLLVTILCTI